jgi:putative hydrolase of the HAD superfamily
LIEAVLFDGDQTLWDFQRVMRTALQAVLVELRQARPGALSDRLSIRDVSADRNSVALELDGVEYNLSRLRTLGFARTLRRLRDLGSGATERDDNALARDLSASYFRHRDRDPALFDDALPCLEALRGTYRLGLLSNGSRLPEAVGLDGHFEAVVFGQDHMANKPDRAIFAVVEREMDVEPAACVLVGDHPLNDVVGAKRSGWRAVWIDRLGHGIYTPPPGCSETPDGVIATLVELRALLASW